MASGRKAVVPLTQYQRAWIEDKSRFKIGMWSRQSGKTFGTTLEIGLDVTERPRSRWVCLSRGERQSRELMSQLSVHLRAIGRAIEEIEADFKAEDGTVYKQLEVLLANGSRVVGLPANPDTARGWSANVYLDEFAIHKDSRAIWTALFPTITRGYRIAVTSTPLGKQNRFYEMWTSEGTWSKHKTDIFDAVAGGLKLRDAQGQPCTPEDLRRALDDDEAWAQEYLLEFLDEATAWLSYDLIGGVEHDSAARMPNWAVKLVEAAREAYEVWKRTKVDPGDLALAPLVARIPFVGDLYLGMDVARKRDLSVQWLDEEIDGIAWTRAAIDLAKTPFWVQEKILLALLSHPKMRRGCIDETGIGAQLAEKAKDVFGESKVEGIPFTSANKEVLATVIKNRFEDNLSRIPADSTIRQSLHQIKRFQTATGHFRFDAERSEATGHADHFWAKALAEQARTVGSPPAAGGGIEAERGHYHAQHRSRIFGGMAPEPEGVGEVSEVQAIHQAQGMKGVLTLLNITPEQAIEDLSDDVNRQAEELPQSH